MFERSLDYANNNTGKSMCNLSRARLGVIQEVLKGGAVFNFAKVESWQICLFPLRKEPVIQMGLHVGKKIQVLFAMHGGYLF